MQGAVSLGGNVQRRNTLGGDEQGAYGVQGGGCDVGEVAHTLHTLASCSLVVAMHPDQVGRKVEGLGF